MSSGVRQGKTQGAAKNHLHHINTDENELISHFERIPVPFVAILTGSLNLIDSCSFFVPTCCRLEAILINSDDLI